jgi:hypothetical protein
MTQHILQDPETGEMSFQRHGQLMGSVVSFPVLCIANATVCRMAMEFGMGLIRGQGLKLSQLPLSINGDDAVFRTTYAGYKAWERLASSIGLTPSLGKVYRSRYFLNINSTNFNYAEDGFYSRLDTKELVRFEQVRYVNLGIMMGMKRSGGKVDIAEDDIKKQDSVGSRAHELIREAPSDLGEKLLCKYLSYNSDALKSVSGIPWFIPAGLGGFGLPIIGRYRPSDIDLRIARKIHNHPELFKFPSKPKSASWYTWDYALQRTSDVSESDLLSTMAMEFSGDLVSLDDVRGWLCVESLFLAPDKLYRSVKPNVLRSAAMRALRRRANVWRFALTEKSVRVPEPYNIENFPPIDEDLSVYAVIPSFGERVTTSVCLLDFYMKSKGSLPGSSETGTSCD